MSDPKAEGDEKPENEERAVTLEKTTVLKRAVGLKKTTEIERASGLEKPLLTERAEAPEKPEPVERPLGSLVIMRDQIQKVRISEGNRAGAYDRLEDIRRATVHRGYEKRLELLEQEIESNIAEEVKQHPAWPWLEKIRGVGPTSAALVLGEIDIERANSVSALWKFAGWGVTEGKRDRMTKGETRSYNSRLKTYCWRLIDLQVKLRGPYRKAYDDAKNRYITTKMVQETDPWTRGHCDLAARRKAAKLFLSHLYQVWREAEGLPVTEPWIIRYGGLEHDMIDPWEYVV